MQTTKRTELKTVRECNNPYPPDYLDNYRLAIRQHDGPLVGDWEDKPRRLGYDLLHYAEYLEQVCKDQRKGCEMTNKRLEEIERALAATTPGNWEITQVSSDESWISSDKTVCGNGDIVCLSPEEDCPESLEFWGANRAFIIAAHNSYIPELLAEVKRLRAAYKELFFQGWGDGGPWEALLEKQK